MALLGGLGLACQTARALVTLNDGTDKIFVTGTYSMGYDSNISASSENTGDLTTSAGVSLEYQRRAGLIGVNAGISYALSQFAKNRTYNSSNPSYSLEFDKSTGRTTGTLNFSAQRSSQADVAANLHDVSWNLNSGLNLHYPVIERYSITASLNYNMIDYTQTGGQPLSNLNTIAAATGIFYVLSDERDLYANYRFRNEQSSANTSTTDHGLSVGVSGKIYGQINGNLSFGYQIRYPSGTTSTDIVDKGQYHDFFGSAAASWHLNKKTTFNLSATKDFATTSTNATTDTTAGSLGVIYSYNSKISAGSEVGYGITQFLGPFGLIAGTSTERRDTYFSWSNSFNYTLNGHLKLSLTYLYFQNSSNLDFAVFKRNSVTLTLTSRW